MSASEARAFEVTVRILDRNVTEQLLNRSHPEFQDFSRQLLLEVKRGLHRVGLPLCRE